MPESLAIVGLVVATLLYALLVRRRAEVRSIAHGLSRALAASNDIAMGRLRASSRPKPTVAVATPDLSREPGFVEKRWGDDRRTALERRRGRGRRTGNDRRQNDATST